MNKPTVRRDPERQSITIFLSIFLPAMLVVVLVGVGSFRREIRAETALVVKNEELLIGFERTLIANQLNGVLEDMRFLAEQAALVRYVSGGFDPSSGDALLTDYMSFLQRRQIYGELQVVGLDGMERIRIPHNGTPAIHPAADLKNQEDRDYFQRAANLAPETIYISNLDLSEAATAERGAERVIRFAAPLYDAAGDPAAVLMLNYKADNIIRRLTEASAMSFGNAMLLDPNGYRLHSHRKKGQFGPVSPERSEGTFAADNPDIWSSVARMDEGIASDEDTIYVFATVYPLHDPHMDGPSSMWKVVHDYPGEAGYYWHLVSYVPKSLLRERTAGYRTRTVVTGTLIIVSLSLFSLMVTVLRRKRLLAEFQTAEEASIFAHNPAPVLRATAEGRLIKANPAAHKVFAGNAATEQTIDIFFGIEPDALSAIELDDSYQFEQRLGHSYYFFTVKRSPGDRSLLFYGSDITSRKEIQKEITKLSAAVEQSATSILITDLDGVITFANSACAKSSGYPIDELIGQHTRVFRSGAQPPEVYTTLWSTIAAGNVWTGEMHNRRRNGEFYWEELSITPIRDEAGAVSGYLAVKEDITSRKETEEQLTKAKEEAESASRLKSEFLMNMSHEIRTPMNAILGFTDFLMDDEQNPEKLKNLRIIKSSGKHLLSLISDILDFSKIEADRIDIEITPFALRGTIEHIKGIMTESIHAKGLYLRAELTDRVPPVVEGDEHRITQILLNILGNAIKFTADGGIDIQCDYRDSVAVITVSDTGVGIPAGKLELIFDPFQQANSSTERTHGGTGLGLAICRRLARLMGGSIRAESEVGKGSSFVLEVPLPAVDVEEAQLLEAFDDETDGIPDPAPSPPLPSLPDVDVAMVASWLRDAGSDEMLRRVVLRGIRDLPVKLEKLRRATAERDVATFANIVHDLKGYTGNLHLNEAYEVSKRLFGLTLSDGFVLQDATDDLAELESVIRRIPPRVLDEDFDPGDLLGPSARPFSILTAEDNETNQELVRILLASIGLESDFVADGRAVLTALEQKKYDLLLLDMQMPIMGGQETIEAIRRNESHRDLHVIAITAHAMEGDADRYLSLGCNDYLSKPIDRELFAEKIKAVLNRKSLGLVGEEDLVLSDHQRRELVRLVEDLRENASIFNPGSVLSIGRKLRELSPVSVVQDIAGELQEAARGFDDNWVKRIVSRLENVLRH